ncbi:Hypothetical predicted protein [Mytilus galloprovincialis]|uniref:C-type lectin domain-containing protein n=1 Tax=Mytilus galloprovincialis TaxID=29158 RepID=A0A8B6D9H9_MYTGA|nr:Hypothetical predicted protein [Mytilus galloprovincialis]
MEHFCLAVILLSVSLQELTGLQCYSCDDVQHPSQCNVSQNCSQSDKVCITAENVNSNFQFSYKLGCADNVYCHTQKKRNLRHFCCSSNLCNKYDITTSATKLTSKTTSTIKPSTTVQIATTPLHHTTINHHYDCNGKHYYRWNGHGYCILSYTSQWKVDSHGHDVDPCIQLHMKMITLETDQEHDAVVHFVRAIYKYQGTVWLGAKFYPENNTRWHWLYNNHGISAHNKHWESRTEEQEHQCLGLHGDKWGSDDCTQHYPHLCEKVL